ncbi:hypothetical protein Trydic_g16609 [Trypoxylus dichotomus]
MPWRDQGFPQKPWVKTTIYAIQIDTTWLTLQVGSFYEEGMQKLAPDYNITLRRPKAHGFYYGQAKRFYENQSNE